MNSSDSPASPTSSGEKPLALLPARMLNEFVYCPRLFYYEHVDGVFLHSAATKRGASEHTRVDAGKGAMPKAKKSENSSQKTEVSPARAISPPEMNPLHRTTLPISHLRPILRLLSSAL